MPGEPLERAPLMIGRLEWEPRPAILPAFGSREWIWLAAFVGVLGLALALGVVYGQMRSRKRGGRTDLWMPGAGEVIPIEQWLEESGMSEAATRSDGREDKSTDTCGG